MANLSVSIPQGTRDFGPKESSQRSYIFNVLLEIFKRFGFMPLETPSMENLSTLTGKYGEEGDQLIYKIINSGDFMSKVSLEQRTSVTSRALIPLISERALRYDLTVPFARYVAMNHATLNYPFKRFQIQPVWRADRPQKGRYREFFQCDVDTVGSSSILNEAELICIYDQAFKKLGIPDFTIRVNNRKLLLAMAALTSKPESFSDLMNCLDKLDKIGEDGVQKELLQKGFNIEDIQILEPFFRLQGTFKERLEKLSQLLSSSEQGKEGIAEMEELYEYLKVLQIPDFKTFENLESNLSLDILLARGLNYYTGTIIEVVSARAKGSLGGGGRYDNLTGIFGLKGVTGVGISFGADRIYDLMEELNLFPPQSISTQVMVANFYLPAQKKGIMISNLLRNKGIATEFYPDPSKLQKQLKYASNKQIPFVVIIGEEEFKQNQIALKDMNKGEQYLFGDLNDESNQHQENDANKNLKKENMIEFLLRNLGMLKVQ